MRPILAYVSNAVTVSGNSSSHSAGDFSAANIDISVEAFTATSIVFKLSRQGTDGTWYPFWVSDSIVATGKVSRSIGPGLEVDKIIGDNVRLEWVYVGGGGVTFSASVTGLVGDVNLAQIAGDVTISAISRMFTGPTHALVAAAATGAGASIDLSVAKRTFGLQVILGGSVAATGVVVKLEGSADGGTTWATLATWDITAPLASGAMVFAVDKPVSLVRANLTTLTGGTAPTVDAYINSAL